MNQLGCEVCVDENECPHIMMQVQAKTIYGSIVPIGMVKIETHAIPTYNPIHNNDTTPNRRSNADFLARTTCPINSTPEEEEREDSSSGHTRANPALRFVWVDLLHPRSGRVLGKMLVNIHQFDVL